MLQITVLPGKPHVQEGTSSKTGKAYRIVQQAAFVLFPNGEAAAFTLQPPRDSDPYEAGTYTLAPDSFYVRDGQLNLAPRLVRVGQGAPK